MSIVRSLLIKVGLVTDKSSVNQTNRAINGFKRRFALAASAATYAFTRVVRFFGDISTATLNADELAKNLRISFSELVRFQKSFQNYRVDEKQFNSFFTDLNKNIHNFRYNLDGELRRLAEVFKFDPTAIKDVTDLFNAIINKLSEIDNFDLRKDFAEQFFPGMGVALANISGDLDKFNQVLDSYKKSSEETEKLLPEFKEFEQSLRNLNDAWENFIRIISKLVFPILIKLFEFLGIISNLILNGFNLDLSGLVKGLNEASGLFYKFFEKTGLNKVSDFFKNNLFGGKSLVNKLPDNSWGRINDSPDYQYKGMLNPSSVIGMPPVTNNFEIQVPPGTTQEQASFLSGTIERDIAQAIFNSFRQIQNNNPVVE